jgi:hypothetical protein
MEQDLTEEDGTMPDDDIAGTVYSGVMVLNLILYLFIIF